MNIRLPAVSGSFYPASRDALLATVDRLMHSEDKPVRATALMMPHAGLLLIKTIVLSIALACNIIKVCLKLACVTEWKSLRMPSLRFALVPMLLYATVPVPSYLVARLLLKQTAEYLLLVERFKLNQVLASSLLVTMPK